MQTPLPTHLAIIMDGNGRWARQRHRPRVFGHRQGAQRVREVVEECVRLRIPYLTLYAFSEENWRRPAREVSFLMELLNRYLVKERERLVRNNVRLQTIGNIERLPLKTQKLLKETEDLLATCDGLCLTLALSYSGQSELAQTFKTLAFKVQAGELDPHKIDAGLIANSLSQPELPSVDLMIRSSGERRISNFMLWRLAYAELFFSPMLWPDFDINELHNALDSFAHRERRFGALTVDDVKKSSDSLMSSASSSGVPC